MNLEEIMYALTVADRPHKRGVWIRRGFKKLHGARLFEDRQRRLARDPQARALAKEVWLKYQAHMAHEAAGPGSKLSHLLSFFGIREREGCKCKDKAKEMNARGPDWCAANLPVILGWMRLEAKKRGLRFHAGAALLLVRFAIFLSRRALRRVPIYASI